MPSLKKMWKNIVENDKDDRFEDCYRVLENAGISVCNAKGEPVSLQMAIEQGLNSIGRYDPFSGDDNKEYCLDAFEERGLFDCSSHDWL